MNKTIVAVNGVIGSGKDTLSNYFVYEGFYRISFAESLKDAVSVIFGWDRDMLEGKTEAARKERDVVDEYWSSVLGMKITPRWILQNFGTDCIRKHFNDNIWIYSLTNKINKIRNEKIIITDCRFPNEIEMVRKNSGTIVEIQRVLPDWYSVAREWNTSDKSGLEIPEDLQEIHTSEWAWIGINNPDFIVQNNAGLDELKSNAQQIIKKIS